MAPADAAEPSRDSAPRFAIQAARRGATYVVRALGELDLEHSDEFRLAMERAEASDAPRVLIDLDGLWFIDSTGLRALVEAARRNATDGGRVRFTRGTGEVAAIFRLTALDQTLPFQ